MDESVGSILTMILVIGGFVLVVVLINQAHKRRLASLEQFATAYGLQFVPGVVDGGGTWGCMAGLFGKRPNEQVPLMDRYGAFHPFGQGDSPLCSNLLYGRRGELELALFDYQYSTGSGKNRTTHSFSIAGVLMPYQFQGMEIRSENVFHRLGALVGVRDIQFEMEEFNRRFFVTCGDPKFAYDVLHPEAMEWLLHRQQRHWQFLGTGLVIVDSGSRSTDDMASLVQDIEGFLALLPPFVREDTVV